MASALTPRLPLHRGHIHDYEHITEYKELVKQNFKNLMLTVPGERIMDLDFGIGLRRFLFEMDNPSLYSRISARIQNQVKDYLPYIDIVDIQFNSDAATPDSGMPINFLGIILKYIIIPLDIMDVLELTLPGN